MFHRNILSVIRKTVILSLIIFSVTTCKNIKQQDTSEEEEWVSKEEVTKSKALPRIVLKDGKERDLGKIRDEKVLSWASKLSKDFMIYLYSENGEKSDILAKKLRSNGFTEALSIIGGIEEWERRYGDRVIINGIR